MLDGKHRLTIGAEWLSIKRNTGLKPNRNPQLIWIMETLPRSGKLAFTLSAGDITMTHIEAPFAWGLTRGMARVLGINLVDAVSEGWFSRSDLAEMVDTCETCGEVRRCSAYLATAPRAESLPVFCDNKHRIEALQP
jgi:hypothetical protein